MSNLGTLDAIRFSSLLKKFVKSPKSVRTYYPLHLLSCTYQIPKVDLQEHPFGTSRNFSLIMRNFWIFRAQYYRNSKKITSFRRKQRLYFPTLTNNVSCYIVELQHTFQQSIAHTYISASCTRFKQWLAPSGSMNGREIRCFHILRSISSHLSISCFVRSFFNIILF